MVQLSITSHLSVDDSEKKAKVKFCTVDQNLTFDFFAVVSFYTLFSPLKAP